jgi:hypothetical protein
MLSKKTLKIIFFLILIPVVFITCDNKAPNPEYPLNLITGAWKPVEMLEHGASEWKVIPSDMFSPKYTFRYDGLLLSMNGRANCCLSQQYIINGEEVTLQYQEKVPFIDGCELMFCFACPSLNM